MLLKNLSIFFSKNETVFLRPNPSSELGVWAQKKPSSFPERFLVGKRTGVSNLFDDIESVVSF
jgi:hypothetical protein